MNIYKETEQIRDFIIGSTIQNLTPEIKSKEILKKIEYLIGIEINKKNLLNKQQLLLNHRELRSIIDVKEKIST